MPVAEKNREGKKRKKAFHSIGFHKALHGEHTEKCVDEWRDPRQGLGEKWFWGRQEAAGGVGVFLLQKRRVRMRKKHGTRKIPNSTTQHSDTTGKGQARPRRRQKNIARGNARGNAKGKGNGKEQIHPCQTVWRVGGLIAGQA